MILQAGAKHVYAVEASEMAEYARKLIAGNPFLADRITVTFILSSVDIVFTSFSESCNSPELRCCHLQVIKGKVEEVELPEKADMLISEPMGTCFCYTMDRQYVQYMICSIFPLM